MESLTSSRSPRSLASFSLFFRFVFFNDAEVSNRVVPAARNRDYVIDVVFARDPLRAPTRQVPRNACETGAHEQPCTSPPGQEP